jgi:hypothetical protein
MSDGPSKIDASAPCAWVVTADMGLGHQRAAYPLAYMAEGGIITAGDPDVTDASEARLWRNLRTLYEFVSRSKEMPLIGPFLFRRMDYMLRIPAFYPLRDLSKSAPNNLIVDYLISRGLGKTLMKKMETKKLPMISTYYAPSLVANHYHYNSVYSVICDADINRVWVASKPRESGISYFAPCGRVMRRLRAYGVPDERIFITGFPLPKENIGSRNMEILKSDLLKRLGRLDPRGRFASVFGTTLERMLGGVPTSASAEPVTVTFAIGGAGAQVEIGQQLAISLKSKIQEGSFKLKFVVGINRAIERTFAEYLIHIGLDSRVHNGVEIICEDNKFAYFDRFNRAMRETDILWTKPSELSFYSALGIPIVIAPTIGSQEDKNQKWLMDKGCALPQYTPLLAAEWLQDMLKEGILAEKAFNGFIKNRKLGVYKIEEVLKTGTMKRETDPLKR